jgi:putative transposase
MQYNSSILITYQYRLNPTPEQASTMGAWGELLRQHYNYCLGQRLDWLRRTRCQIDRCSIVCEPIGDIPEKVDYYTQASQLRQTKELFPEYKNIYADCQQQNLMRLDKAWKRWLIPDQTSKRGGRPRFKKRGDICSFTFPRVNCPKAGANLTGNTLKLSKIGEIEVIVHRPIPDSTSGSDVGASGFVIKQATLVKKADGWYVSFCVEDNTVPEPLPVDEVKSAVGIDVGLEKFLATSDGQAVEIPQFYRKSQLAIARQQRQLEKTLEDRVHNCPYCGLVVDRDWNSGKNILNRVQRTLGLAFAGCGGYEDARPMRQQFSIVSLGSPFYTAKSG